MRKIRIHRKEWWLRVTSATTPSYARTLKHSDTQTPKAQRALISEIEDYLLLVDECYFDVVKRLCETYAHPIKNNLRVLRVHQTAYMTLTLLSFAERYSLC
jgi:hypothetical protein